MNLKRSRFSQATLDESVDALYNNFESPRFSLGPVEQHKQTFKLQLALNRDMGTWIFLIMAYEKSGQNCKNPINLIGLQTTPCYEPPAQYTIHRFDLQQLGLGGVWRPLLLRLSVFGGSKLELLLRVEYLNWAINQEGLRLKTGQCDVNERLQRWQFLRSLAALYLHIKLSN